jgi:hypothetical protein
MPNNSQVEKRWACVKDGKVEQVIIWDGVQEWPPAEKYTMVELAEDSPAGIDWDYIDGEFVDNRPVETFDEE